MAEAEIEKILAGGERMPQHRLIEAMRYSLLAGGKRIRPVLVLAFCEATGKHPETALPAAVAIEMLHTYTLIHDDLPCMDNDELRRGKPTNHIVFGEFTAMLAGDALQAEAFGTILRSGLPTAVRAECAEALANAAGIDGVCGGQQLDMEGNGKALSEQELTEIQSRKTGSLLAAACLMGAIVGGATEKQKEAALIYGVAIGVAFQIRDDILDEISTAEELGKPIGSDRRTEKPTFMSLHGREECEKRIGIITEYAKKTVSEAFPEPSFLMNFADELSIRRS
ncbi:MAG: geranyl transferase [Firmicutes bacterium HGW-Firmicutes-16]|nr:MAG: geranyl transferase [Firmicutes bacterium HGW-Firmicutes-16]